jgi:hypothetical protein
MELGQSKAVSTSLGPIYAPLNTLASRGLEEPAHALRGLEELFLRGAEIWGFRESLILS